MFNILEQILKMNCQIIGKISYKKIIIIIMTIVLTVGVSSKIEGNHHQQMLLLSPLPL